MHSVELKPVTTSNLRLERRKCRQFDDFGVSDPDYHRRRLAASAKACAQADSAEASPTHDLKPHQLAIAVRTRAGFPDEARAIRPFRPRADADETAFGSTSARATTRTARRHVGG